MLYNVYLLYIVYVQFWFRWLHIYVCVHTVNIKTMTYRQVPNIIPIDNGHACQGAHQLSKTHFKFSLNNIYLETFTQHKIYITIYIWLHNYS
jgi:hypothetical protein